MTTQALRRQARRIFLFTLLAGLAGAGTGAAFVTLTDLPQVEALRTYRPKGITTLRDIQGKVVHEFYLERRIPLTFDQIPERLRKAFLAAEDWRFYEHFGLDLKGMFRAAFRNVTRRRLSEGASTITQQLAKVLFLTPEKTLRRKLKEAVLSLQIERKFSKNEILALYLNQIYLGAGCYGVEAASRTYFNKSVAELDVGQMALLAGLPKSPNTYSPFRSTEAARTRRDVILREMYSRGVISKEEWQAALESPVPEKPADEGKDQTYFTSYVLNFLDKEIGDEQVYRGHLEIQTTLDADLQRTAEAAIAHGVAAYAARHRIPADKPDRLPQAALIAIDVGNGEIRAMVGGRSFVESPFNRAVQAVRQPGSAFKPILYAAAIERGYTQATIVTDEPISLSTGRGKRWTPKNYDDEYDGPMPLRVALEQSKNTVAVRLLESIGNSPLRQIAIRLGIDSPIEPNLTSALGSSSLRLSELVRAYATFANGGYRPSLRAVRSVRTSDGIDVWEDPPIPSEQALYPEVAYIVTDMLTGVIRSGTGVFAADLPCDVAGKTGTTDGNVDSLFAGFTSRIAAVAWVGFDDRKSLGGHETGAVAALPIWKEFMAEACKKGAEEFPPPTHIALVDVDHSSGKLPGPYCTDIVTEAFLEGTAPTAVCNEEEISGL